MRNIFADLPDSLQEEVFEVLAHRGTVRIERIVSKGHCSPEQGWYDQDQAEWVLVLRGAATLSFENAPPVQLTEGSYLTIPVHQKHRVDWTDPTQETIWLAVFF